MRQKIDIAQWYRTALRQAAKLREDGRDPLPWPDTCPSSLVQLLAGDTGDLEACLTAPPAV